jgi:iron complex outermembrane recepter protein
MAVSHPPRGRVRGGPPGPRLRAAVPVLAALALALAAAPARASGQADTTAVVRDTVPAAPVYRLAPLEATVARDRLPPDRVPFAISVVDVAGMHPARPAVDLQEVLRSVPGVVVANRHSLANDTRVIIRGFGARSAFGVRGVRLVLDGIPLTLPDGQATLTNVDPGSLGRVEVLRGPAAALYGNAAGGVIALTTAEAEAGGWAEGTVAAGSYGTNDPTNLMRLQANAGGGGAHHVWTLGLSRLSTDGFRDYSRATRTGLNGRYRRSVGSRTTVSAVLHVASVPLAENPGALPLDSALARPRMAWPGNVATRSSKEVRQTQGGLALRHTLGPALLEVAGFGLDRRMDNPLPFGRHIRLNRSGGGARVLARSAYDGTTTWSLGFEAQTQRDDRVERDNVGGEPGGNLHQDRVDRVTAWAPFGLAQWSPHPRLALRAGGRYDAVAFVSRDRLGLAGVEGRQPRRVLDAWSGSGGALVDLGRGTRAWVSASTWFQTPTTTELINAPPAPGEPCCGTGFNQGLEPQDGWGAETGVAGRAGALSWEVVLFDLRVRNEILPFQVEGIEGRDFYRNAGRSRNRGLEMGIDARLAPGWTAGLSYAYSGFRFEAPVDESLTGNRLPGIPPQRLDGRLSWRRDGLILGLDVEWVDRMPVNDANTAHAPRYTTLDLRAAREIRTGSGTLEPFIALTNMLDARYSASVVINAFGGRFHEPAPGRSLLVGLRARLR